jgi:pre-mRNA-splicing factor ATP-dependent RNA helicase DHX15/PRP43
MNKIGILDPIGINKNPLNNKKYENLYISEKSFEYPPGSNKFHEYSYKNLSKIWTNLLVYKKRMDMISSFEKNQVTLVKAGTGVGKTVLIPKFALHQLNYKKKVICCIPKKIITKETADFAAKCLDVKLGEQVGYYYKGEKMVDENNIPTMLTFTTIGSLFSRITGNDPNLEQYNTIIIDEAHERSIQTDFTLLLIKKVLQKRKDLKLIIMSATIDLNKFRNFYKEFKFGEVDAGSETTYEIKDYYLDKPVFNNWKPEVISKIKKIIADSKTGDILVFVRSGNDGRELCNLVSEEINTNPFCIELESKSSNEIHPVSGISKSKYATHEILYKSHPDKNSQKSYTRKIVMSTNVAESSITVKGVVYVIDSGLEFVSKFDPRTMSRSLLDEYVPQSSVKQRRGRAGRTQNGFCYHLYTKQQYDGFKIFPVPEIQKTDLSSEFLDLLRMKDIVTVDKLKDFLNQLIDPPVTIFVNSGLKILESLDAIENNNLSELGNMITQFRGLKPNYAKSIIMSHFYNCRDEIIDLISLIVLLDGRFDELFKVNKNISINKKFRHKNSDHLTLLNVIRAYNKYVYGSLKMSRKKLSRSQFLRKKLSRTKLKDNNDIYNWCKKYNINYKMITGVNKTAIDITKILNTVLKEHPNFKINTSINGSIDRKILDCLSHDMNIAKHFTNLIYQTIVPLQQMEAKVHKHSSLIKPTNKIIFDELFLSNSGYTFNIVSEI